MREANRTAEMESETHKKVVEDTKKLLVDFQVRHAKKMHLATATHAHELEMLQKDLHVEYRERFQKEKVALLELRQVRK